MSVADSVRAAAEAAVKESERKALEAAGMVYDSNSGMYYDYNSGYYYDAVCISFRKLSVKPRHWLTRTSNLSYVDPVNCGYFPVCSGVSTFDKFYLYSIVMLSLKIL